MGVYCYTVPMFLSAPPNPTKIKHILYLCATTLLGILLSTLAHIAIESLYLNWAAGAGHAVQWYWSPLDKLGASCALHPAIQIVLLILGAVGGFFLGRLWWKWVYVERRWAKGLADIKGR